MARQRRNKCIKCGKYLHFSECDPVDVKRHMAARMGVDSSDIDRRAERARSKEERMREGGRILDYCENPDKYDDDNAFRAPPTG